MAIPINEVVNSKKENKMETKKAKQAIHINWDLFSRLMTLRGKMATPENRLKVKDMIESAIIKYLEDNEE